MKQFFRRLWYVFTATKELDALVEAERKRIEAIEREDQRYRLDLCHKHRQEPNHSDYSERNCNYCQLENHAAWLHSEVARKDALLRGAVDDGEKTCRT